MGYRRPGSSFKLSSPHVMSTGRSVTPESFTCLSLPTAQLSFADLKVSLPPPPCLLPPMPLKRERRNDLCGLDSSTSRWILDNQLCCPLYLVNILIKSNVFWRSREKTVLRPGPVVSAISLPSYFSNVLLGCFWESHWCESMMTRTLSTSRFLKLPTLTKADNTDTLDVKEKSKAWLFLSTTCNTV